MPGSSHLAPPPSGDGHIITDSPYRLRWGDWRTANIIQVHVHMAAIYEDQRQEDLAQGRDPGGQMPPHFVLDGGMHETAQAILRHRQNEESLGLITYLAALMEALINMPCAILRTDMIRRVYQEVEILSNCLGLRWRSRAGHFLLPLNENALNPQMLEQRVGPLDNLQEFFRTYKEIAAACHQSLAKSYVIYFPRQRGL